MIKLLRYKALRNKVEVQQMSDVKNQQKQMTTFDIETEYQQQIAPIEKKLSRIQKSYETKSLRLHKGFLTKEKKAQTKLNKIDAEIKKGKTKVESSTTNKLSQLNKADQNLKKSLKSKSEELKNNTLEEINGYHEEIDAIRDELHEELEQLHTEYLENIHVYKEKLDSYETLSKEKQSLYNQTYTGHIASLNEKYISIETFTKNLQKELVKTKKAFIKDIQKYISTTEKDQKAAINDATKNDRDITKRTNTYTSKLESFIDSIKASYVNHYQPMLKSIKDQEVILKDNFQNTLVKLKQDFAYRTQEDDTIVEQSSKTYEKNYKRRLSLFEERYELYKQLEETLVDRKLALLSFEQTGLRQILDREMINLDKLEIFLKYDFEEIKDYSANINNLEKNVFVKIEDIHKKLHHHLEQSASQMIDFVDQFNERVMTFERNLISLVKNHLEQLHERNQEIDRLDREIDLSEPQKEIALNDFEENLALEDIKNRYQIKILNKEHEIHLINLQLNHDINIVTLEHDKKRLENDFDITSTKIKGETKLDIENAKRKFNRAKEIFHLRENSLKHDEKQSLLTLETKKQKLEIEKEKASFEAEKSQLLLRKEISQSMDQLFQKRDLEGHLVHQKYSEQVKAFDQKIEEIHKEITSIKEQYALKKKSLVDIFEEQVIVVKAGHQKQLDKLQEAFERECKIPEMNIKKWNDFQNEKSVRLEQILHDFDQQFEFLLKHMASSEDIEVIQNTFDAEDLITNSTNTIFGLYDVYLKTVDTLFSITNETLQDQASLSIDTTAQRKLARDLERRIKEFEKQITNIKKARDQQVKSYVVSLSESYRKMNKQKFQGASTFIDALKQIHTETASSFEHLKKELIKEINELFSPITQQDNAIIRSAKESHSHAKSKLEDELNRNLRPIEKEHEHKLSELDNEQNHKIHELEDEIQSFEEKKEYLHKTEAKEISVLNQEYDEKVAPYKEHLASLDESLEKGEIQKIEEIDKQIKALELEEKAIEETFEEKIAEAKRILDYEEKIEQTTIENLKSKEDDELSRKRAIIDDEIQEIDQKITAEDTILETNIEQQKEHLYNETSRLGHENYLSNPKVQKEMQKLRNKFEDQEVLNREELLNNKKLMRQIIESFDQQMRVEYTQFFDQLNHHIEKMKQSYTKNIDQEIHVFQALHEELFNILEKSYHETLKSMKSHTLELTQQLYKLNKNLS
jgi:hypothetical protein